MTVCLGVAGCQKYERKPLDPEGHWEQFLARTPASPEVGALAELVRPGPAPFDPSDGLSLDEAEIVALVYNPELRLARLKAGVAGANAANAGRWDDPMLGGDVRRFIQSAENPWMLMASIGITLPVSGRLTAEKERAGAEHSAELAEVVAAEWRTRVELREQWLEWSAAANRRDVQREFVERLDGLLAIVARLEQAGELAGVRAGLFRIEQASLRVELAKSEGEVRELEQRVRRVMGLAPRANVQLVHAREAGPAFEGDAIAAAMQRSPELAAARAGYEIAERALALEIRKQYPDLTLSPGYGREDGMDEAVLGFAIPLPFWNRNRQGIAVATAERDVSAAEYHAMMERLASDIEQVQSRLETARIRLEAYEQRLLPLAKTQYETARRIAELGEVDVMLLLESLTRLEQATLDVIEARAAEAIARVRLDGLIGPEPVPTASTPEVRP